MPFPSIEVVNQLPPALADFRGVPVLVRGTPDRVYICMGDSTGGYRWMPWFDGDGRVYIGTVTVLPTASAAYHNTLLIVSGPPDNVFICLQATGGNYFLRQILSGDADSIRNTITGL